MSRYLVLLLLCCTCVPALAQEAAVAPPADFMRSIGKMYVVVAVIVVVFLGLAYYLWRLDRRLTIIENQIEDHA
ncbi:heme/copper-type cytochrome/quinol oxidase subunit 2 [Lewinella marina]|uniref:CcmD family protein n=1 Tax=Neolewinella marina TaxID=438751 RepID=UPI0016518E4C|nr:CcmD family protein [Neolewinella marina]NJB85720.1 heme/copper-type cytochrome/quinol oxidase subunit 2 [Neolewinella marina]